eukprot:SAG25_NODE_118_length_14760_cov_873.663666_27_plen_132_part_01
MGRLMSTPPTHRVGQRGLGLAALRHCALVLRLPPTNHWWRRYQWGRHQCESLLGACPSVASWPVASPPVTVARNRRTHLRGAADAGVFCPERHHLGLVLRLHLRQPQLVRPLLLGHRGGVRALLVREQRRPL